MKTTTTTNPVTFEVFLSVAFPRLKLGPAKKRFHEFFRDKVARFKEKIRESVEESELERIVRAKEQQFKAEGFTVEYAQELMAEFRAWHKSNVSHKRALAAKSKAKMEAAKKGLKEASRAPKKRLMTMEDAKLEHLSNQAENPTGKTPIHRYD